MKIAFAGTPEFALASLQALHAAGHDIVLVLTQPDRPAGRGMKLHASPVKTWAVTQGMPLAQPRSLRLDGRFADDALAAQEALRAAAPDVLVVAAYGLILPPWALMLPRLGCINVHASLLPRWRGAAPIHRAIEAGDSETGITIMQMDAGLDTGPMLLRQAEAIHGDDTTAALHERLAALGGQLIVQALAQLATDALPATPQPSQGASYANKIDKSEAAIDWKQPADVIARRVRAFDPFPGATLVLDGELVKVWRAAALARAMAAEPMPSGRVVELGAGRIGVACGEGVLEVLQLQASGGRRQSVQEFLRGHDLPTGTLLAR